MNYPTVITKEDSEHYSHFIKDCRCECCTQHSAPEFVEPIIRVYQPVSNAEIISRKLHEQIYQQKSA